MIRWLFDVSKYFTEIFKHIHVFFVKINSNKCKGKFLFYCLLSFYFIVNISVSMTIFVNFLLQFDSHKYINQSYNLTYYIVFACFLLEINFSHFSVLIILWLWWSYIVWTYNAYISSGIFLLYCQYWKNYN